jgi:folate-binding protein YgfZ
MSATPLGDKLTQLGARRGEFCGLETALCFTDPRPEFISLLHGCGVYDLGWRACFTIAGRDRGRWLNAMLTNNLRDLPPGHGNYNFLLTAQGHIQGDMYVYNCGEDFVAVTERPQLEHILKTLRKHIIMDQVELTDLDRQLTAIGVQGPRAGERLRGAEFAGAFPEIAALTEISWHGRGFSLARRAGPGFPAYEVWMPPAEAPGVWDALTAAGAAPVGVEALEMFRVAAGIPRYGADIRERDLPQETGQMHALHFAKGCYIGQEIVERIRSRGNVHRTFTGFEIEGVLPAPGANVQASGKDAGEITSAQRVPLPEDGGWAALALGYVRRENAAAGSVLQAGQAMARITSLPFDSILPRPAMSQAKLEP